MKSLMAAFFALTCSFLPQFSFAEQEFESTQKTILFKCGDGFYSVNARVTTAKGINWAGSKPTFTISFEGNEQSFPSTKSLNEVCAGNYTEEAIYFDDFRTPPLAVSYAGKETVKFKRYGPFSREYKLKVGQTVRTTKEYCDGAEAEITGLSDHNGIFVQLKYATQDLTQKCLGGSYCDAFNGSCIDLN